MGLHLRQPLTAALADEEGEVLRRWGLSRCHAVDVESYWAGLSRLLPDEATPPREPHRLIAYIRGRFHRAHRDLLEDAVALAGAAEAVHARDDAWPHGLGDHLAQLLEDLESHLQREDSVVFPLLPGSPDSPLGGRVAAMADEHRQLCAQLDDLRRLTRDFAPPAQACVAWRLLYVLCGKLDTDLREQMTLEEDVLFAPELRVFPEDSTCANTTLEA